MSMQEEPLQTFAEIRPKVFSFVVDETFTLDVIEDTSDYPSDLEATDEAAPQNGKRNGSDENLGASDDESGLVIDLGSHDIESLKENRIAQLPAKSSEKRQTQPHLVTSGSKSTTAATAKNSTRKCPYCPYKSDILCKVRSHQMFCKENKNKSKCPHCNVLTLNPKTLKKHIWNYHPVNPAFKCPKCPFGTNLASLLAKHKLKHKAKSLKCELCSFETADKGALKKHQATAHKNKILRCGLCRFSTVDAADLKKHQTTEHFLMCGNCSFRATCPEALEKHRQCHVIRNGSNVVKCKFCEFTDAAPEVIRRHEEKNHSNEGGGRSVH